MTFGERLRDARVKTGFSQAELTKRSGVPKTMLSRYENDHILPSITTLVKLAEALDVNAATLLGDGIAPSHAFVEDLFVRGITLENEDQAAQLAGVVADMVAEKDSRVAFLRSREQLGD